MTVQDSVSTSRPAGALRIHETGRDSPRPAGPASATSPLLAVCGLGGGSGTSTLSYLVARFAVVEGQGHVLVCDTAGPGGLAACARVQSQWSLVEAAGRVARRLPLHGRLYAIDEAASSSGSELRVIATGPRLADSGGADGLDVLLAMARGDGAHALTVVDCGTLQKEADRLVLRSASHIAWTLLATNSGLRRAERVLAAIEPAHTGRELVVARRDCRERAALRTLRVLAERRRAPLVLVPHLGDPLNRPVRALDEAQVALQAILGALGR